MAVIDGNGALLNHAVVYPHPPQRQLDEAGQMLCTAAITCDRLCPSSPGSWSSTMSR